MKRCRIGLKIISIFEKGYRVNSHSDVIAHTNYTRIVNKSLNMKKQILLIIPFFLITISLIGQSIEPAPTDKAVIYFTRTSSLGFAINFSYFDSTKLIGVFNGPKYIRYECEPGAHLFWARSENRDFIEAEVEAGKIYFIQANVKMGAIKAGVELQPIDPNNTNDTKKMNKIFKLLNKKPSESFSTQELQVETERLQDSILRGLEKYEEDKKKGKTNSQLKKTMCYNNN